MLVHIGETVEENSLESEKNGRINARFLQHVIETPNQRVILPTKSQQIIYTITPPFAASFAKQSGACVQEILSSLHLFLMLTVSSLRVLKLQLPPLFSRASSLPSRWHRPRRVRISLFLSRPVLRAFSPSLYGRYKLSRSLFPSPRGFVNFATIRFTYDVSLYIFDTFRLNTQPSYRSSDFPSVSRANTVPEMHRDFAL